jgi:hypothetical protein
MGVIDVLGLISGVMGFWGFVDDMFPAPQDGHSTFKVYVGLDQTANPSDPGECCLNDAGGSIRYSKLFNIWGDDIGHGGMFGNLKSGSAEVGEARPERVASHSPCLLIGSGNPTDHLGYTDHHHVAECPRAGRYSQAIRWQRRHLHRSNRCYADRRLEMGMGRRLGQDLRT